MCCLHSCGTATVSPLSLEYVEKGPSGLSFYMSVFLIVVVAAVRLVSRLITPPYCNKNRFFLFEIPALFGRLPEATLMWSCRIMYIYTRSQKAILYSAVISMPAYHTGDRVRLPNKDIRI